MSAGLQWALPHHRNGASDRVCGAGWALAVFVGLVFGGQSPAAEFLTLQGVSPTRTFEDNVGTPHEWHIFGNDAGLDIQNVGGGFPFRISPTTLTDCLCIEANGCIGFGTSSPQTSLHVSTGDLVPTLRLQSTNPGGFRIWDLRCRAGGLTLTDVTNSNATPLYLTRPELRRSCTSPECGRDAQQAHVLAKRGYTLTDVTNSNATPLIIQTGAPTNTMFLASAGNVGNGTSALNANSRVDIRSRLTNGLLTKRPDAGARFRRVENTGSIFRCGVQGNGDAQFGALTAGKGLNLLAGGTSKLTINSSAQMSFGSPPPAITDKSLAHASGAHLTLGGVWTNASSRALKQDIEPITSEQARDTVRALQPVGYRSKNELDERYVGFIAEDVPELVATNDRKGLAAMDITAVLTKVVLDEDRRNDQQQQTIDRQQQLLAQQQETLVAQQAALASLTKRLAELEQRSAK